MQLKSFVLLALSIASFAGAVPSTDSKRQIVPMANVYTTCMTPKTIALTFDDGPYDYTNAILTTFKQYDAKATFFPNGNNWDCIYNRQQTLQNILAEGHQIGSHTWSHADLTTLTEAQINTQMNRTEDALMKLVGIRPAFMRPPYGNYNDLVRKVAAARGQSLALWDFDSGDSTGSPEKDSEAAYDALSKRNQSSIALNHETSQTTAQQLVEKVVPMLSAAGYKLTTVADCVGSAPYQGPIGTPGTRDATWTCVDPK